jgi:AcrR family transcriptional regulator
LAISARSVVHARLARIACGEAVLGRESEGASLRSAPRASVGSLYQYFPHKEALVTAILERHADEEAAYLEARFAELAPSSIESLIGESVRAVLAFRASKRALHKALLAAIPVLGRYYDLRQRGARTTSRLRDVLACFHVQKPDGPSLDERVFVIANATHSLTHEGLLPRPESMDDERLALEVARMLVAYLHSLPR